MDLSTFDFRTGKMLMSKMNKSRQRVRYDSSNQVKVSHRKSDVRRRSLTLTVCGLAVPQELGHWQAHGEDTVRKILRTRAVPA
jgi:hypothetical protein